MKRAIGLAGLLALFLPGCGGPACAQTTFVVPIVIPATASVANGNSYVSPATRSLAIAPSNGGGRIVYTLAAGASGCAPAGGGLACSPGVSVPSGVYGNVVWTTFASVDGTGAPLAYAQTYLVAGNAPTQPVFWGVLSSLQLASGGVFAAGLAGSQTLAMTALDPAGDAIPAGTAHLVDANDNELTLSVANSDRSGMTTVSAMSGQSATLAYNGDLPFPKNLAVTAVAVGGGTTIASAPVAFVLPKPSQNFTFSFDTYTKIPNVTNMYYIYWGDTPDSKLSVVHMQDGRFQMWWANGSAVSSFGNGPLPENQVGPAIDTFTQSNQPAEWGGGQWFNAVWPINHPYLRTDTNNLVAFYHAEGNTYDTNTRTSYYSHLTARTVTTDGGKTWSPGRRVLTPMGYPGPLTNGGDTCDCDTVYDPVNKRWINFFVDIDPSCNCLSAAISRDPSGTPGTWFKYYNGSFSEPGINGRASSLPAFCCSNHFFSAPDVSWNSYLNEWVMIMDGNPNFFIAVSTDLMTWSTPRPFMDNTNVPDGAQPAYPSLIGPQDDKITTQANRFYFMDWPSGDYSRHLEGVNVTFHRND